MKNKKNQQQINLKPHIMQATAYSNILNGKTNETLLKKVAK